jgi:adenine-specific DNA-methyltransferase
MAPRKPKNKSTVQVEDYHHRDADNPTRPEVGTQARFALKKPPQTYRYDSSLSPSLEWDGQNPAREQAEALIRQVLDAGSLEEAKAAAGKLRRMSGPFLNWAGKAERQSFDVPTLPLFIHERLSTKAIIEALRSHRRAQQRTLFDLFADPQHAIVDQHLRAYEHRDPWVNRLILGDNLAVMNSLVHLEKMAGQVQMIYMDPPYGVKFGSNFQPFVRKRDVTHGDDEDMTREPEMVQAFRDTWEVGLHSYLTCLRERLRIARELLHLSGSIFVQISDENFHHVRELLDEVFGPENCCGVVAFRKTAGANSPVARVDVVASVADYILWYARDRENVKYRQLYNKKEPSGVPSGQYTWVEFPGQQPRPMKPDELTDLATVTSHHGRLITPDNLYSTGHSDRLSLPFEYNGERFVPPANSHWKTTPEGLSRLAAAGRIIRIGNRLRYKRYLDDFPVYPITNLWLDTGTSGFADPKIYVVQTNPRVVERCLLMTTDPGDLVLDPTAGSGTTAYVAEQWGRRWITIDVSRVPLALTRQRLLTATFPWYDLKDEPRGPAGGFVYKRKQNRRGEEVGGIVPHVTLKSIANHEPPEEEVLVDRPEVVKDIVRVTGPFTVEAVIAPPAEMHDGASDAAALNGEKGYHERMLEVLRHSPRLHLPGKRTVEFSGARVPARTQWLSAEAALVNGENEPVAVVFGPENGAVNDRLVYNAAVEARAKQYVALVVVGFAVEANARRLIDACSVVCGVPAVYVQATMDLMMGDLLKNMRSSQILSVCGSPEIALRRLPAAKGEAPRYQVTLLGLDVFNPVTMEVYHRDGGDVPAWFLCADYNDRVFHITQAFFPRTAAWDNLKRSLKGVYDDSLWQHLAGTTSAPFEAGEHNQIAVKVVDDRGNELMVVRNLDEAEQAEPQPRKAEKERPVQPAVARVTKRRGRKS